MRHRYEDDYGFAFLPRPARPVRPVGRFDGRRLFDGETDDFTVEPTKRRGTMPGLPFRVIVESTPETLARIDKLTEQVVIANKTAVLAVGAVMVLGVTVILSRSTERVRVRRVKRAS
jgi:hypothetical protein